MFPWSKSRKLLESQAALTKELYNEIAELRGFKNVMLHMIVSDPLLTAKFKQSLDELNANHSTD